MLQLLTHLVFEVPPPDVNKLTLNYCVSSFMQMWLGDTLVKYHLPGQFLLLRYPVMHLQPMYKVINK